MLQTASREKAKVETDRTSIVWSASVEQKTSNRRESATSEIYSARDEKSICTAMRVHKIKCCHKRWRKISTFLPSKPSSLRAANSLLKTKRKLGTLTSLEGLDCYTWKMCMPLSLTFLFRALSFSTTPSSRDTTESTTGKLLSVFSSSATTIVT